MTTIEGTDCGARWSPLHTDAEQMGMHGCIEQTAHETHRCCCGAKKAVRPRLADEESIEDKLHAISTQIGALNIGIRTIGTMLLFLFMLGVFVTVVYWVRT